MYVLRASLLSHLTVRRESWRQSPWCNTSYQKQDMFQDLTGQQTRRTLLPSCLVSGPGRSYRTVLLLRGAILSRAYGTYTKLYIPPFLIAIFWSCLLWSPVILLLWCNSYLRETLPSETNKDNNKRTRTLTIHWKIETRDQNARDVRKAMPCGGGGNRKIREVITTHGWAVVIRRSQDTRGNDDRMETFPTGKTNLQHQYVHTVRNSISRENKRYEGQRRPREDAFSSS